jgi:hypothetical protein
VRILPMREGEIPPAPEDLDGAAWRRIFEDGRHLTARDGALVALLVRLEADAAELRALLDVEGRIIVGTRGLAAAHPAARLLKDAETSLLAVRAALVLTPAARARAAMAQEPAPASRIDAYRERLLSKIALGGDEATALASPRERMEGNGHETTTARRRRVRPR